MVASAIMKALNAAVALATQARIANPAAIRTRASKIMLNVYSLKRFKPRRIPRGMLHNTVKYAAPSTITRNVIEGKLNKLAIGAPHTMVTNIVPNAIPLVRTDSRRLKTLILASWLRLEHSAVSCVTVAWIGLAAMRQK